MLRAVAIFAVTLALTVPPAMSSPVDPYLQRATTAAHNHCKASPSCVGVAYTGFNSFEAGGKVRVFRFRSQYGTGTGTDKLGNPNRPKVCLADWKVLSAFGKVAGPYGLGCSR